MNIDVTPVKSQAEQTLADQFRDFAATEDGQTLKAARKLGMDALGQTGLPTRRVEAWKYTDLRSLMPQAFPLATKYPDVSEETIADLLGPLGQIAAHKVLLVNGQRKAEQDRLGDLEDAIEVLELSDAIESRPTWLPETFFDQAVFAGEEAVIAVNQAFMTGGIVLNIKSDIPKPILLVHVSAGREGTGAAVYTRSLIRTAPNAQATVIEAFISVNDTPMQHNCVTHIDVEDQAKLRHIKYQAENDTSLHLSSWRARIGENADYQAFQFSLGAAVSRNQVDVAVAGEFSKVDVSGAFMLADEQHCDTTLVVDHLVPNCESRELFKCVLDDKARGIFQGKVIVRPDAQKTDGRQMCRALLLSETAEFDAKPELKIYADDVQCAHGATSGELDDDMLFYLTSRGIPESKARAMLTAAFVTEAFDQIASEELRDGFATLAELWLERRDRGVDNG